MNEFPDMSEVVDSFSETIKFACIGKAVEDFENVETTKDVVEFEGVLQPIPPRKLTIKPEGQRSWKWYTLWTEILLNLDDVVRDDEGRQYQVMVQTDGRRGGYLEYEIVQGPKIEK